MKTGYKCPECNTDMVRTDSFNGKGEPWGHHCPNCKLISDRIMKRNFGVLFKEHEKECYEKLRSKNHNR